MKILTGFLGAVILLCLTYAKEDYVAFIPQPPLVCPCDYKYNPVCGSDGITYINKCVLECTSCDNEKRGLKKITIKEECECTGSCNCQNVDIPVCTLDGLNYPNECELGCENINRISNKQPIIYLAYRTSCRGVSGNCTTIAAPVCGTDNVLYRNRCVLDYVNTYCYENALPPVSVKNNGACRGGFLCPLTKQPVCGSDGKIYNNPCELESENDRRKCSEVTVLISEADPSVCTPCPCPKINDPVCASDGNTYANKCLLDCEVRKRKDPELKLLYKGECRKCKCKNEYVPVCGSDRKTYDNRCWLECENYGRSENLPLIRVFHEGKCQKFACDCSDCDRNGYQPVCGTDKQTYWNICWLHCNDKCCQKNGQDPVYLSKRGPC